MSLPRPRLSLLAAATLLAACATVPFMPDRNARAPQLDGFGTVNMATGITSPAARAWFEQGMAQAYGFNEAEAIRAFKAGLAQDPSCAMCAWGVAWQLGPNINATSRGNVKEALKYVDLALRNAQGLSPRERSLVESLALRYAHASESRNTAPLQGAVCSTGMSGDEKAHPLDIAYADKLRDLVDRYPEDPDLLAFYAEAELVATRDDWWDSKTGKPAGRIGELADKLEAALKRHPEHTGLNHYMIHATDAVQVAGRAVDAADRLGRLAPKSPHLLHMPAHTYVQVGRYADATRVNQAAIAADLSMAETLKAQKFEISKDWRGHNNHFQWYAALMEGRGDLALQTARASAEQAKHDHEYFEYVRSLPILTLLRLERWDEVLKEPMPRGNQGVAIALGEMAKGMALARSGQAQAADEAQTRLDAAAEQLQKKHQGKGWVDRMTRGMARTAQVQLRAARAQAAGQAEQALKLQAEAVEASAFVDSTEPPTLAAGTRLALAELQLKAGQALDAERSLRADLAEHPGSGWALRGLEKALRAQGKQAEAQAMESLLARTWPQADAGLRR
ncbi:hypothetical protein [Pelomonas sp. SE-A7]|uniref:hypothetical protein n=1 Tax=Pelomonas sp. SE-A7 TaxID=3054953 RepID=UPI00259C931B|nr:hypothetical protein [Pelomonas sp. SE-A7]MDM4767750.1 hypothetical protein [Pelomonas sp. SE-A7]